MTVQRRRYLALGSIPVIVIVLGLVVWFVPGGPKVSRGAQDVEFYRAYTGNYYSEWNVIGLDKTTTIKDIRVDTTGDGCRGTFRLIHARTLEAPYVTAVTTDLPGLPVVGRRITPDTGRQLALVLTSTGTGRCVAAQVRISSEVWGRERWTTTSLAFAINVTHLTGADPRVNDGPRQPL